MYILTLEILGAVFLKMGAGGIIWLRGTADTCRSIWIKQILTTLQDKVALGTKPIDLFAVVIPVS